MRSKFSAYFLSNVTLGDQCESLNITLQQAHLLCVGISSGLYTCWGTLRWISQQPMMIGCCWQKFWDNNPAYMHHLYIVTIFGWLRMVTIDGLVSANKYSLTPPPPPHTHTLKIWLHKGAKIRTLSSVQSYYVNVTVAAHFATVSS